MPRHGKTMEKSKDFKGSMKRLLSSLKNWHVLLCTSLILAMLSAIIGLTAPNKLSDFTDLISDGLKPNINEKTINQIMEDKNINEKDKAEFIIVVIG